jgi:hypothetical protein
MTAGPVENDLPGSSICLESYTRTTQKIKAIRDRGRASLRSCNDSRPVIIFAEVNRMSPHGGSGHRGVESG